MVNGLTCFTSLHHLPRRILTYLPTDLIGLLGILVGNIEFEIGFKQFINVIGVMTAWRILTESLPSWGLDLLISGSGVAILDEALPVAFLVAPKTFE